MRERRQLPRWVVGKTAKVKLDSEEEFSRCLIEDINLKGMCVALPEGLLKNHSIRMVLSLEDSLEIDVEVFIPWCRQDVGRVVHGVSFSRIIDEDKDKVYQFISRHCSKQIRNNWWS